ncbi:hypothetical protein PM082_022039 [Marasmius tenuissimus]|nr:hypothetical protein PM082_022039 [Marasmius tenuissimus]
MPRKRRAGDLERVQESDDSFEISSPKPVKKSKQSQVAGPSIPPVSGGAGTATRTKRKGKEKEKEQDAEKRLARYRSACPNPILARLGRALAQRFFLIHRERDANLREHFTVSGSTGNVYTVTIGNLPHCDCPDALKGNHCKHILFVFMKVLHVDQESSHWYQKALLNSELEEIFDSAPAPPQLRAHGPLADEEVIEAWRGATGRATTQPSASSSSSNDTRRIPTREDDCPICYDTMYDGTKTTVKALIGTLEWCKQCGNSVHKGCWDNYTKFQRTKSAESLKCVWCRAPWSDGLAKVSEGRSRAREGYVNLAGLPGMEDVDTVRDTSTYYSRRGYYEYYD